MSDLVQLGKDLLLDFHILEDRLDDEVAVSDRPVVSRAGDSRKVLGLLLVGEPARAIEVGLDQREAFLQAWVHREDRTPPAAERREDREPPAAEHSTLEPTKGAGAFWGQCTFLVDVEEHNV